MADSGRVLVTGASGTIGTAVLALLAERGIPATALDAVPSPAGRVVPGDASATDRAVPDDAGDPAAADRIVVGDVRDPAVVDDALRDATAVIHLAAIPNPLEDPDEVVFSQNTQATFTVLNRAGRAGIERAAIASSYAICGLPFARVPLRMPYLPIDTRLPLQTTDPYALSKRIDEATAEMIHRRYGMTVVALRLPFVGVPARLARMAALFAHAPERGAADVWSYLDARDAARALVAALSPTAAGNHVVYVAAPETIAVQPTEWLLERFHPGVPHPHFAGRAVPIDLAPARELLGFTAEHPYPAIS